MNSKPPSVMISSTFYDLRQIRTDLAEFIASELGYTPLLSELSSFPVEPATDVVENCRRRVEKDADIFVLVIGGRYGSVDKASAKSITNIEYLVAKAKGIPIYAFIEQSVLSHLETWGRNPSADFSHVVDDIRIFEFIKQVRSQEEGVWSHEFEVAQDIIATLRIQFSYLMEEGLQWKLRMRDPCYAKVPSYLSGKSLRLVIEKPDSWEYRLFAQSMIDEIKASAESRREHELELKLGPSENVPDDQFPHWTITRIAELENLLTTLTSLINQHLQEAFGPPGTPGDVNLIVFVAKRVGIAYREALTWSKRVRLACVSNKFKPVIIEFAKFTNDMIGKIELLGSDLLSQIEEALAAPQGEKPKFIHVKLDINASNYDRCIQAYEKATKGSWRRIFK